MFTGGLAYMVRKHGGIDWIIMKEKEFKGANLEYIKKYFGEDKDIILN